MKVIVPGHEYEVSNLDKDRVAGHIQFIEKKVVDGKLVQTKDGTTTEEILRVVIDRVEYLNTIVPCRENAECLKGLAMAMKALDSRIQDRKKREVFGTNKE